MQRIPSIGVPAKLQGAVRKGLVRRVRGRVRGELRDDGARAHRAQGLHFLPTRRVLAEGDGAALREGMHRVAEQLLELGDGLHRRERVRREVLFAR